MLSKIKGRIEQELTNYICNLNKAFSLNKISPILFKHIKDFVSRKGKRVRPTLFVLSYLGYTNKIPAHLYTSAISLELLHDFMLIHDDIIDKSDTRRGKPSMHSMLNRYLQSFKDVKFRGEDLAIVIGDVMYALAMHAFLSIKEDQIRKEKALKKFIEAAIYTASGEFAELLYGMKKIEDIKKQDIYKIYDLKTAYYSFATPLTTGAMLAGANQKQVSRLFKYGIYLGRAFQIKDDILGMFSSEKEIGKSGLTDLKEAKKTILIWFANRNSIGKDKLTIKRILLKENVDKTDLTEMRKLIIKSKALEYAKKEILDLTKKAEILILSSGMFTKYKKLLFNFSGDLLKL